MQLLRGKNGRAADKPDKNGKGEGGVRLEWSIGHKEVSLEIDLDRRSGEWHVLDFDADEEEARTLDLDDETAWNWMGDRLAEMVGATRRD